MLVVFTFSSIFDYLIFNYKSQVQVIKANLITVIEKDQQ